MLAYRYTIACDTFHSGSGLAQVTSPPRVHRRIVLAAKPRPHVCISNPRTSESPPPMPTLLSRGRRGLRGSMASIAPFAMLSSNSSRNRGRGAEESPRNGDAGLVLSTASSTLKRRRDRKEKRARSSSTVFPMGAQISSGEHKNGSTQGSDGGQCYTSWRRSFSKSMKRRRRTAMSPLIKPDEPPGVDLFVV